MSIESPFPGPNGREPQHYSFVNKKNGGEMEAYLTSYLHTLGYNNHYILRYSYQLHGSVMAINLPNVFEFADSR